MIDSGEAAKAVEAARQAVLEARIEVAIARDSGLTPDELCAALDVYGEFGR